MLDVFVRYVLCPSHDRHEAVGHAAAELGCFLRNLLYIIALDDAFIAG